MRIAIYYNLPSGGAKRSIYEVTRRLTGSHEIDVYSPATANHDYCDLRPVVNQYHIYPYQPSRLYASPFGRLNQALRLFDLKRIQSVERKIAQDIQSRHYDIFLSHPCQYQTAPSILSTLNRIPKVYYCHEPLRRVYEEMPYRPYSQESRDIRKTLDRVDPLPGLYFRALKRDDLANIRKADRVLVNSIFTQQAVRQIYAVEALVSYQGVDTDRFHPQYLEKENLVLTVGSLTPLKSFDFIIKSIGLLPAENRPRLVIVSNFENPSERAYLEDLVAQTSLRVDFLVGVSDDLLVSLYNRARLTLYAPIREPLGLVALESLACGTPVVAVGEGGLLETVIDGQVGFLVKRSEGDFAQAVQKLLHNPHLAAQFGAYGREYVTSRWTWDAAARALESHLEQILVQQMPAEKL